MNREEAIANLNMISVAFVDPVTKEQRKLIDDTFDMAIKALEQEPCEDAISRQAVQDYIANYLSQYLYNDVREAVEVIDEYIGELPSVNPRPCEDAISRQASIDFIINHFPFRASNEVYEAYADCVRMLGDNKVLPPVNPTKTGHWIDDNENEIDAQYGRHLYRCSKCNEYADMFIGGTEDWWDLEKPNYCPNCGARMVKPQERSGEE